MSGPTGGPAHSFCLGLKRRAVRNPYHDYYSHTAVLSFEGSL